MRGRARLVALLVACVLAELACRALRLPFFPSALPLLMWGRQTLELTRPAMALYCAAVAVLLFGWWGIASVGLSAAIVFGAVGLRVSRGWWRSPAFLASGLVAWMLVDALLGHLPVGEVPLEVLVSAVMTNVAGEPLVAALGSRLVLLALVLATLGAAALAWRVLPELVRSRVAMIPPLALVLIGSACGSPDGESHLFVPARPGSTDAIVERFADPGARDAAGPHVVLPPASRTRAVCGGCHQDKVEATSEPTARKGIHEIHLTLAELKPPLECTDCHPHAGAPGFPRFTGRRDRRTAYNQRCRVCHRQTRADGTLTLRWNERFR